MLKFSERFMGAIETQCSDKPATVTFYRSKLSYLLKSNLAKTRLDAIEEDAIEGYKNARTRTISRRGTALSVASVNRELATLRRLLRMAHEFKMIWRVPRIRLIRGEGSREFVLSPELEPVYLAACQEPLKDIALLLLDTGLRLKEATSLDIEQVHLNPAAGAKFGYLTVGRKKSKNSKPRNVPLSPRCVDMLWRRCRDHSKGNVFLRGDGKPLPSSGIDHQHDQVRKLLKLPAEFVVHSLRHTFGTRLGESGADPFTIMKLMGHSSITVSQKYVHPSPESIELAYERLQTLNKLGRKQGLPTISPTAGKRNVAKTKQVI